MPQLISFRDVVHKGKPLCDCLIDKDITLEEALIIYCKLIKGLQKATNLDQVRIGELGIRSVTQLTYNNLLTDILNALIQKDIDFSSSLETIRNQITQLLSSISNVRDEKVKASANDTTAGFLNSKITTNQPGCIEYQNSQIILKGFVPIGAVMMINRSRLVDFDVTGKGKVSTDVYGWAISNGQNGTINRLGSFPRYATDPLQAGNKSGNNTITLIKENIPGFDMTVEGTISDALTAPVTIRTKFNGRSIGVSGNAAWLLDARVSSDNPHTQPSEPVDLKHTHNFNLTAKRINTAQSFSVVPEHILEIPIERIPV